MKMIEYKEFKKLVVKILGKDIESNKNQDLAIKGDLNQAMFIVAGPGSGKTTVMVLKILKYIFVDGLWPDEIIATTFTVKASNELNSRILEWGTLIKEEIIKNTKEEKDYISNNDLRQIIKIDFSLLNTGTLDGMAYELLQIYSEAGSSLGVLIENFVCQTTMLNASLLKNNRFRNKALQEYLASLAGIENRNEPDKAPIISNPSKMSDVLLEMKDRFAFDRVDIEDIYNRSKKTGDIGHNLAIESILDYQETLKNNNVMDFSTLERLFLESLEKGKLKEFMKKIKIILVDEYQDTNLLQENIYFKLAEIAIKNGGNINVVGDDDQSLYRFRGATVNLFTDFKERIHEKLNQGVIKINLSINYRSNDNIIDLCNHFVNLDDDYQNVRVSNKDEIKAYGREGNIPILGMFRNDEKTLSKDLTILIKNLNEKKEHKIKVKKILKKTEIDEIDNNKNSEFNENNEANKNNENQYITLKLDEKNGSLKDLAYLTYSPKEVTSGGNRLLPFFLRKRLFELKNPIKVFNPRGQDIQSIEIVQILCGLILEAIDPNANIQKKIENLPILANKNMKKWRKIALSYIQTNPSPVQPLSLEEFMNHWQLRLPLNRDKWSENVEILDLTYKIIYWIKDFQEDPESLIYLEAITQTIKQNGFLNEYKAKIHFDNKILETKSIEEAIWNIFLPIATGGVQIDENLLSNLPEERFNIMSIHQSKGLEFPFVMVDIGSKFKKNNINTAHLRFPRKKDRSSILEDSLREFSPLGISDRNAIDRIFDDLTRLYFVAFSRAQDVLLLVGLTPSLDGYENKESEGGIPNIALGWTRNKEFIGFNDIYLI
jgi:DNA helicase-2/ATP-dependent DNA helicase PcrA